MSELINNIDAHDLKSAIAFVKANNPTQIKVDVKGWVRIRRDLIRLNRVLPQSYSSTPDYDKWLWHEHKALMRLSKVTILGVPVVWIK